ncbi:hypothetical protein HZH68_016374 [Vespula germanica]|uniref:Histone acetyltransferase n=1 Tax=Vespula germanica TaxID=30212 RepID=A0A834MR25_VESGE|nr:hypothetical protein HZH68_016374 [Vespula germanica]
MSCAEQSYHQSQLVSIRRHSYNVENELNCLSISCDRQALFMKRTCYTRITVCVCLWNPDFTEQLLLLASLARDKPFLYTTLFFKMKEHKFCYLLTRVEKKIGSPEKPLSDLGLISYRSYWKDVLLQYLCNFGGKELSVKDISKEMAIDSYDIVSTLQALGMMKYWKGKHIILKKQVGRDRRLQGEGEETRSRLQGDRSGVPKMESLPTSQDSLSFELRGQRGRSKRDEEKKEKEKGGGWTLLSCE